MPSPIAVAAADLTGSCRRTSDANGKTSRQICRACGEALRRHIGGLQLLIVA
jgi:hypothetical protein